MFLFLNEASKKQEKERERETYNALQTRSP